MIEYSLQDNIQQALMSWKRNLQDQYNEGKRIFLISNVNPDHNDYNLFVISAENFRTSVAERIALVFCFEVDPSWHSKKLTGSGLLGEKKVYLNLQDDKYFQMPLDVNQLRYRTNLNLSQIEQVKRLSGGIPILIKQIVEFYSENNDLPDVEIESFSPISLYILSAIPIKELVELRNSITGIKISSIKADHYKKIGFIDEDGNIISSILTHFLSRHSLEIELKFKENTIWVGNDDVSSFLPSKKKLFCRD
ncbi:MAG TPA: hypothetical protein PK957_04880 [Candidatus Dojkabacteria bacterium]|nr:hypothetical protein [Candidatus Dojkabacteria bacterium]HQF36566.1 hypothetical protein [Candidatus Dojkabacteria bacterium]